MFFPIIHFLIGIEFLGFKRRPGYRSRKLGNLGLFGPVFYFGFVVVGGFHEGDPIYLAIFITFILNHFLLDGNKGVISGIWRWQKFGVRGDLT
jgi:hypothetical protein